MHTPAECCEVDDRNIELSISLLDQRLLAGDADLYGKLARGAAAFLPWPAPGVDQPSLAADPGPARAVLEHDLPHGAERQGDARRPAGFPTGAMAEPASVRRSRTRCPSRSRSPNWMPARDFLSALRCYLHYKAGRDSNLLSFDAQEEITEQPFIRQRRRRRLDARVLPARPQHPPLRRPLDGTQRAQWQRAAHPVPRLAIAGLQHRVHRIAGAGLPQDSATSRSGPGVGDAALFVFVARHGIRLAADSERRIVDHLPALARGLRRQGLLAALQGDPFAAACQPGARSHA